MPKTDQVFVIRHKALNERVSIPQAAREMGVSRIERHAGRLTGIRTGNPGEL